MKKLQLIPLSFGLICVVGGWIYLFSGEDSLALRLGSALGFTVIFILGLWAGRYINLKRGGKDGK